MCDALAAAPLVGRGALIVGSVAHPPLFDRMISGLPYTAAVSGLAYLACSPIVHLAHRRPASAITSFALRAALPLVAALFTYAAADRFGGGWQTATVAGISIPSTFGAALAIDCTVLAR